MSLFFLSFFLIYGGIHLYLFLKVKAAFSPGSLCSLFLALFLLWMVVTPALIRILEKHDLEALARFAAHTGYLWMGFIFLFFCASLALDVYHGLLHAAGALSRANFPSLTPEKRTALILALAWATVALGYGYFEALTIRTERVVIRTAKIPADAGKLTIVQISDVHLGLIVRHARLKRIIAAINTASPDLLVSTGDLVDGQINRMTGMAELLQDIRPRFGKFAVTGNHEVYAGLDQALSFTERAGFTILRNAASTAEGLIRIAGVEDPAIARMTHAPPSPEQAVLSAGSPAQFTLLLKHRPVVSPESLGLFDLQLSGHVHQGQIFPFNLLTRLSYPVNTGLSPLSKDSNLYVSRGTGTWGPPIRLLAPPEVTVIELIPEDSIP